MTIEPDQSLAGSRRLTFEAASLREIDRCFAQGAHHSAIERVDRALPMLVSDYGMARALLQKARAQSLSGDHFGAALTLAAIDRSCLSLHPDISSYVHLTDGQLNRRRAHDAYKQGQQYDTLLNRADASLRRSELVAQQAGLEYAALLAQLNHIYVRGLRALTCGCIEAEARGLFVSAVHVEIALQNATPRNECLGVLGLLVLGDLARGGDFGIRDAFRLSSDGQYFAACTKLFGSSDIPWSEILSSYSTSDRRIPLVHQLRLEILAATWLLKDGGTYNRLRISGFVKRLLELKVRIDTLTPWANYPKDQLDQLLRKLKFMLG